MPPPAPGGTIAPNAPRVLAPDQPTVIRRRPSKRARRDADGRARRRRTERIAQWLGAQALMLATGIAASVPIISSTVDAVKDGWEPAADRAIIAQRAWDVFTTHTPLVGQYSEATGVTGHIVYSLGPMLYWLLAIPARVGAPYSLPITMGVMNLLCVVGTVALARRRGGLPLMLATGLGIVLMCQSLPTESFHDMWNPSAGLFPLLLEIFVCWCIACGDYRLLPLMALLASWLFQIHLMYVAPTIGLMAVAIAGLTLTRIAAGRRARRDAAQERQRQREQAIAAIELGPVWDDAQPTDETPAIDAEATVVSRTAHPGQAPGSAPSTTNGDTARVVTRRRSRVLPWALIAIVVALVCWSAPIVEEFEDNPGNITLVVQTATRHVKTVGGTVGWHAVVRSLGITPWWLYVPATRWNRQYDVVKTPSPLRVDTTVLLLLALLLAGLVGAIRRRGDVAAAALIGLVLCAAMADMVASTPASPALLESTLGYTTWWGSQLGMWVWLVVAWSGSLAVASAVRRLARAPQRRQAVARAHASVAHDPYGGAHDPYGGDHDPHGGADGAHDPYDGGHDPHGGAHDPYGGAHPADTDPAMRVPRRRPQERRPHERRRRSVTRPSLGALVAGTLCATAIAAVGSAVAATGKPDEHVKEYKPIKEMSAALERAIPPGQTINLEQGTEDWATMPIKPGLRYWLTRHGDRVLAVGSYERLGDWYELFNRPYQWIVEVTDGLRPPARHMKLVVRVHFHDGWGPEVYSAWVRHVAPPPVSLSGLEAILHQR